MSPLPEVAASAVAGAVDDLHLSREERLEHRLRTVDAVLGHCAGLVRSQVEIVGEMIRGHAPGADERAAQALDSIAELQRSGIAAIAAAIEDSRRRRRRRREDAAE